MASVARPLSIPLPNGAHLHLISLVPFGLIHVAALGIFFFPFKWSYLITAFVLYEVRMFFVTAGYHRYFRIARSKPAAGFSLSSPGWPCPPRKRAFSGGRRITGTITNIPI